MAANNQIAFSIVMPTYNRGKSIQPTLDSITSQTFLNWELLVIDDGSIDETEKVLSIYQQMHKEIKYFKRPVNYLPGGNGARNYGVDISSNCWIAFMDDDDCWDSNYLERRAFFIKENNSNLAFYSGAKIQDFQKRVQLSDTKQIEPNQNGFEFLISPNGYAPTPSMVLHKSVFSEIRFNEKLKRHQDWDFFIQVHKEIGWKFHPESNLTVIQKRKEGKIDLKSCIKFYEMYRNMVRNKITFKNYLFVMLRISIHQNDNFAFKFYRNELWPLKGHFNLVEMITFFIPKLYKRYFNLKFKKFMN